MDFIDTHTNIFYIAYEKNKSSVGEIEVKRERERCVFLLCSSIKINRNEERINERENGINRCSRNVLKPMATDSISVTLGIILKSLYGVSSIK